MSKLLFLMGSLLIILSLCTCRTARQGSQEAPTNAVSSLDSTTTTSSCEDFWQYVQQNWEYDSTLNVYLLSSDAGYFESKPHGVPTFLQQFIKNDSCIVGRSPTEIVNRLGKPTREMYDQPSRYTFYKYRIWLNRNPSYGEEVSITIHGRPSIHEVGSTTRELIMF